MTYLERYAGRALFATEYPEVIILIKLLAIGAAKGSRTYPYVVATTSSLVDPGPITCLMLGDIEIGRMTSPTK